MVLMFVRSRSENAAAENIIGSGIPRYVSKSSSNESRTPRNPSSSSSMSARPSAAFAAALFSKSRRCSTLLRSHNLRWHRRTSLDLSARETEWTSPFGKLDNLREEQVPSCGSLRALGQKLLNRIASPC